MDRISVEVEKALKQKVKIKCLENCITIKEYVINLILQDLNK